MECIDKRKEERIDITGLIADITLAEFVASGPVMDISPGGLTIHNVSRKHDLSPKPYEIIIKGYGSAILLSAQPCWTLPSDTGNSLEIGFQILHLSQRWNTLFQILLPEDT